MTEPADSDSQVHEFCPGFIVDGARAVIGIADHFERLKQAALPLLDANSAGSRGYFTPSEDEELRHLLVSYGQSRNALIELVISLHRRAVPDAESAAADVASLRGQSRAAAFLVAWAGALVLIDAARFLRHNCEDRPVLLKKLNEPEPHFGIPAGTYDRVQKSLTSPLHAWHLYHARQYWTTHHSSLVQIASGTELEPWISISPGPTAWCAPKSSIVPMTDCRGFIFR